MQHQEGKIIGLMNHYIWKCLSAFIVIERSVSLMETQSVSPLPVLVLFCPVGLGCSTQRVLTLDPGYCGADRSI